jgi:hypothetical protein
MPSTIYDQIGMFGVGMIKSTLLESESCEQNQRAQKQSVDIAASTYFLEVPACTVIYLYMRK